jgi:hypothetical protein
MSNRSGAGSGNFLAALPRVWWFPGLRGYRSGPGATYLRHPLDTQPPVPAHDDLSWLADEDAKPQWSIADGDAVRPLTAAGLEAIIGQLPMPVPPALRLLAERGDLQRKIRSATACFLDLGDFAATAGARDGHLIHLLADQQWCLHWLVYLDTSGNQAVLTTTKPICFNLGGDEPALPPPIPTDDEALGLCVCADTVAEFLYRFWIENEIFFALHKNQPLSPAASAYAARLTYNK